MKIRRALTHVGGETSTEGDEEFAAKLARALDVPPAPQGRNEEGPDRAHVHGFHAYPARLHPITAARLIDLVSAPHILDPFCGSGTVLVEAMIAGMRATGIDLNPVAVRLSACKTRIRTEDGLRDLVSAAERVRAHADDRRKKKAGATRRYDREDVRLFEPHVLLELDGIASGIRAEKDPHTRRDLEMVLSAILVKVSRKQSDTSQASAPRRLAAGWTAKLFVRKTEELARRAGDFNKLVPSGTRSARVLMGDALRAERIADASIGAIITSPPYAATYDYLAHHALRMRWLGLESRALERGEVGARRSYEALAPSVAREKFEGEISRFFAMASRVLVPGGTLALVIADSGVRGGALRADAIVRAAMRSHPLRFVARASQKRPHFHARGSAAFRREARSEHAILLKRC
jgi:hypothetical protein